MFEFDSPEVKFAVDAVRQACLLVGQVQAEMVTPALTKEDRSPVTVADFAAQALIASMMEQAFPHDSLVGEEDSTALQQPEEHQTLDQVTWFVSRLVPRAGADQVCAWIDRGAGEPVQRFWTLDPIDGTKGFLRGDQYAVALALIVDGQVQIGVLGCPNLEEGGVLAVGGSGMLGVAVRGQGAWMAALKDSHGTYQPARISSQQDPTHARLLRSFESGHTNISHMDQFAHALGVKADPIRMDSQAKYILLSGGQGELYLRFLSPRQPDYREKIWDQAAGSLLVEEAGGRVTDLHGRPLDFSTGRTLQNNRGLLASNGYLHPAALQALNEMNA